MLRVSKNGEERNLILAALPRRESRRLLTMMQPLSLSLGEVLFEAGEQIRHVYFPSGGLVSLLTPVDGGKAVEVGVVGREGFVGLAAFLGTRDAPFRAVVQGEGPALRLPSESLQEAVRQSQRLADMLHRYLDTFLVQLSQTAACRSLHNVPSRYCYWLLMAQDRLGSDLLPFNQKFLAMMLAVRLASVTQAAGALRKAGLIRYSRKGIHILDRAGLEAATCSCYQIIRKRIDQVLT